MRSPDTTELLRELSNAMHTYSIAAFDNERFLKQTILLILEREVKKEPIWPES